MANFKLDSAGIGRYLRSAMVAKPIGQIGQTVGANVRLSTELPVEVRTYTTDRAGVTVLIAHPAGAAEQAKHGTLTRAVTSVGLRMRAR